MHSALAECSLKNGTERFALIEKICTNLKDDPLLKVSLIKGNYTISIDVSETVPNINYTVYASRGTIRMAFTSIYGVVGAMIIAEIVIYKSIRAR